MTLGLKLVSSEKSELDRFRREFVLLPLSSHSSPLPSFNINKQHFAVSTRSRSPVRPIFQRDSGRRTDRMDGWIIPRWHYSIVCRKVSNRLRDLILTDSRNLFLILQLRAVHTSKATFVCCLEFPSLSLPNGRRRRENGLMCSPAHLPTGKHLER